MNTPPNMTTEQAAELKALRKEEAAKLKAVTKLEKSLRRDIDKVVTAEARNLRNIQRRHREAIAAENRAATKLIKPFRTQLHRLNEGRVPEASALAAIRKRIAILEQRLTS